MAELSLSKFRANVSDLARPNRFWVSLGDPSNDILAFGSNNDATLVRWQEKHEFLAKSASLPGRSVTPIDLNWQGMKYSIAGDPTFSDITLVFLNNYEFDIKNYFESWMEVMAKMSTNERSEPSRYKSDVIRLQQLGRTQNDILKTYRLIGAYPTDLAAIDLSHDSNDSVEEISVTMKYDCFEIASNG